MVLLNQQGEPREQCNIAQHANRTKNALHHLKESVGVVEEGTVLVIVVNRGIDDDDEDIEDDEDCVAANQDQLGQASPIFLESCESVDRILQNAVHLVPLHDEDQCDDTSQKVSEICSDAVPDPVFVLRRPSVINQSPQVGEKPDELVQSHGGHDDHAVQILVHSAL